MSGQRVRKENAKQEFYRALPISELVRLMRQGTYGALAEFSARYAPLLQNHVEHSGFHVADVETVVADLLSDIAASLITSRALPSCSMETYVLRCFRKRLASVHRRAVRDGDVMEDVEHSGCSEGTVMFAAGPAYEPHPLPRALERLSTMLDEGLSIEERTLLVAVSEYVSQRDIAEWLGVSHEALRKQLERLRRRLRLVARRYVSALDDRERAEIRRFFARVEAILGPSPTKLRDHEQGSGQ